MTKQEFLALGLSEDLATKCAEASKTELATYIPKSRFDEVNESKKQAEKDVKDRDKQLEDIKKNVGDNAELQKQIEALQGENKKAKEEYEAQIKEVQLNNAIKLELSGKAHDETLVAGLFDKSKLILSDDGKVTGLTEQLEALQKDKAFLFKQQEQKLGFSFGAGGTGGQGGGAGLDTALAQAFGVKPN